MDKGVNKTDKTLYDNYLSILRHGAATHNKPC